MIVGLSTGLATVAWAQPKTAPPARLNPQELLRELDKNRDKKISKEEAAGPLATVFDEVDTNNDGFLTLNELRAASQLISTAMSASEKAAEQELQKLTYDRLLEMLDKNGDGVITRQEVPAKIRPFFGKLDANRDGKLTREEFEKFVADHQKKPAD